MFNGNKLSYLRKRENMTQEKLAKLINVSSSSIGMYETSKRQPDTLTIKNIANIFGVTTDYLLDNDITTKEESIINNDIKKHNLQSLAGDELGNILLEKYGNLTEKDKKLLTVIIKTIAE